MAGGLPIQVASSEAWPENAAMYSRALNTGWIFDQRFDGAGGFVTNCTPTSSGLTFISTGNATGFYVIGRAVQIIQAAGTAIATVGQSSFAVGITTVYLNQFSTQSGLSTVASTGVMTSVAASPVFPGSTGNNTFGGAAIFSSTSGDPGIGVGAAPALTGNVRGPALASFKARSIANSYDELVIGHINNGGGADQVQIGVAGGNITPVYFGNSIAVHSLGGLTVGSTIANTLGILLGASAGSSGYVRFPNSAIAIVGKTSTGGDDIIWPTQFASTTLAADVFSSGANYTTIFTKSLGVGTWDVRVNVTMNSTGGSNWFAARLFDGTNVFASAAFGTFAASTVGGVTLSLGAVVSHTTALTYTVDIASNTTASKAVAIHPASTAAPSTGATNFVAVKIG